MNYLLNYLFFPLPSFVQVPLRRLFGQKIGKGSKIKIGTLFNCKHVEIGNNTSIGPFSYIKADEITIGNNTNIKSLSVVSTRKIELGNYVHIAPLTMINSEFTEFSILTVGDHSRFFPFCWLDTGEGIYIGNNVGVGGHTLIFTHGVWPNYLEGGPVSFGPVTIKDNVWLPWRIFILPNVTIGENSIVAANSLVNKKFPDNVLLGGNPAKILKENISQMINEEQRVGRLSEILIAFSKYIDFKLHVKSKFEANQLFFEEFNIIVDNVTLVNKGDMIFLLDKQLNNEEIALLIAKGVSVLNHNRMTIELADKNIVYENFIPFLRRYGIRLNVN